MNQLVATIKSTFLVYFYRYSNGVQGTVVTYGVGSKGVLESMYMDQLQAHCKKFIAAYSAIVDEYDRACIRAATGRSKSSFPDKSVWNPLGRNLTSTERLLLLGLTNDVIFYKSFYIRDPNTYRCITYGIQLLEIREQEIPLFFLRKVAVVKEAPSLGCYLHIHLQKSPTGHCLTFSQKLTITQIVRCGMSQHHICRDLSFH